jgi:peptide/nickel transport system substrate-binding protein
MMIKENSILLSFLFIFLLIGCKESNRNQNQVKQGELRYVLTFPDANSFSSSWSKENTLVAHLMSDPANLHPASFSNASSSFIMQLTQGHLLQIDLQKPQLVPGIVKAMPQISGDQLQFTYEILDEAQWDDGTPVVTDDVIFTLKVHKCPLAKSPSISAYTGNLKTVVADPSNPKKFTLVMKRPYVQNESFLTDVPILCEKFFDPKKTLSHYSFEQFDDADFKADQQKDLVDWSVEFNDGKYGTDPSHFFGCGPYKVTDWDRGHTVMLERKENYWAQKLTPENIYLNSFPEKIIFKIMKDENAIELEFKAQTFDVTNYVPTKVLTDLQADSTFNLNYESAFMQSYGESNIIFNMKPDGIQHKKLFDDLSVRKAFALLTPVDQIIQVVILGKAIRWPCAVSPLRPDFNSDLTLIPYNLEEANKILDQAGWKDSDGDGIRDKEIDGEKIQLQAELIMQEQGNLTRDISSMIAESAQKAGIKITPHLLDQGTLIERFRSHDFDLGITTWSSSSMQEDFTQLWHTHSWGSDGSNYGGFGNATTDALVDSIKYTLNDSLRYSMSKRLQKIIYDDQPYVFMYSTNKKIIMHKRWGNQIMSAEFPSVILNNLKLLTAGQTAMILSEN